MSRCHYEPLPMHCCNFATRTRRLSPRPLHAAAGCQIDPGWGDRGGLLRLLRLLRLLAFSPACRTHRSTGAPRFLFAASGVRPAASPPHSGSGCGRAAAAGLCCRHSSKFSKRTHCLAQPVFAPVDQQPVASHRRDTSRSLLLLPRARCRGPPRTRAGRASAPWSRLVVLPSLGLSVFFLSFLFEKKQPARVGDG